MSKELRREVFRGMQNPVYRHPYTDKDTIPPPSPVTGWFSFRMFRRQTILIALNIIVLFGLLHQLTQLPPRGFLTPAAPLNPKSKSDLLLEQINNPKSIFKPPPPTNDLQHQLLDKAEYMAANVSFPKKIWQTWKTISLPNDDDYRNTNSWTRLNPSHEYELLTDRGAEKWVIDNYNETDPFVVHLFQGFKQRILAADLLRYLVTYKSGGLYTDMDTQCNKAIDGWITHALGHLPEVKPSEINFVVGMELDILDKVKYSDAWVREAGFSQRIQFNQWSIYAKPGHEILRRMLASLQMSILSDIQKASDESLSNVRYSGRQILDRTGPFRWTKAIWGYVNDIMNRTVEPEEFSGLTHAKKFGDVLFLPVNRMSPGVPHSEAGPDETSYLIHHFKSSWKDDTNPDNPNLN